MTEAASPAADVPGFPLWFLSVSTDKSQSSQWVREPEGPLALAVHPESACGIHGSLAWLESRTGKICVRVRHDANQRRDVAVYPKGGSFCRGQAANALIQPVLTDMGEGGALYDERVRLVPMT